MKRAFVASCLSLLSFLLLSAAPATIPSVDDPPARSGAPSTTPSVENVVRFYDIGNLAEPSRDDLDSSAFVPATMDHHRGGGGSLFGAGMRSFTSGPGSPDDVMVLLQQNVMPEGWVASGGTAAVSGYAGQLVISAPPKMHEAIDSFLTDLRKRVHPSPHLRIEIRLLTVSPDVATPFLNVASPGPVVFTADEVASLSKDSITLLASGYAGQTLSAQAGETRRMMSDYTVHYAYLPQSKERSHPEGHEIDMANVLFGPSVCFQVDTTPDLAIFRIRVDGSVSSPPTTHEGNAFPKPDTLTCQAVTFGSTTELFLGQYTLVTSTPAIDGRQLLVVARVINASARPSSRP